MSESLSQQVTRRSRLAPFTFRCTILFLFIFSILLSGCNTQAIYNDDRYNPPVNWGRHLVKKDDTLYGIAWRYGRDVHELANANGISAPFTIRPGQVIRLDLRGNGATGRQSVAKTAPSKSSARGTVSRAASKTTRPQGRPETSRSNSQLQRSDRVVANINWRWPFIGPVIAKYSTSGVINKGIDIAGAAGDPVRAAADGEVVYAGSGLLGYGELIIVNHNERYLSAYAHNRRILVKEGQSISQGQQIAELGASGTNRNKLHFEIRKDGNPVDPLQYLPSQ